MYRKTGWVLCGWGLALVAMACGDQNTRPFGSPPDYNGVVRGTPVQSEHDDHAGHDHGPATSLPLPETGQNSEAELTRDSQSLEPEARALFEEAFRVSFTTDRTHRDYPTARGNFQALIDADPEFAPAWRGLGYALFNLGDAAGALSAYQRAVLIDDAYGEAHYALSFLYVMTDLEAGRPHFERAMELGVPDERSLGDRFYGTPVDAR